MRMIFGPYEPDKPAHLLEGLSDMANAYPGANGYRPVGSFSPLTDTLPQTFNGGGAYVASDSTTALLAGTVTGLYRYNAGAWTEVLGSIPVPTRWRFTQFGDNIIAVNGSTTRKYNLVTATASVVPDAPTASCVATVRDFVVYGQAGGDASMVQWSGFGNEGQNTPGENQAGFQPMLSGGPVMGIAGGEYGLIIQRNRIVRMSYTGDPDVPWQFDEIVANVGAISAGSIAQSGRQVFFLSDRGFMVCDGNEVRPIGFERVDRTFFDAYPRSELDKLYVAVDPRRNVVMWLMPGAPGTALIYDLALDRWAVIRANLSAALSGFTANVSLEELDALFPGGIDTIPYSLDDQRFAGGDPLLLLVDNAGAIGTLSGPNMGAHFTGPFTEIIPGRLARIRSARILSDCVDGARLSLSTRLRLGDGNIVAAGKPNMTVSGRTNIRATGRYVRAKVVMLDGATWTYAQGVDLEAVPGGAR